jgi:hypothetical protein
MVHIRLRPEMTGVYSRRLSLDKAFSEKNDEPSTSGNANVLSNNLSTSLPASFMASFSSLFNSSPPLSKGIFGGPDAHEPAADLQAGVAASATSGGGTVQQARVRRDSWGNTNPNAKRFGSSKFDSPAAGSGSVWEEINKSATAPGVEEKAAPKPMTERERRQSVEMAAEQAASLVPTATSTSASKAASVSQVSKKSGEAANGEWSHLDPGRNAAMRNFGSSKFDSVKTGPKKTVWDQINSSAASVGTEST